MKKAVGVGALALAGLLCCGLAGCGDSGVDVDTESVKGYEVTKERWEEAFDALMADDAVFIAQEDFIMKAVIEEMGGEIQTQEASGTLIKNGAKEYVKQTNTITFSSGIEWDYEDESGDYVPQEEYYLEKTENGYTSYAKNKQGQWEQEDGTGRPELCLLDAYIFAEYSQYSINGMDWRNRFDDFHYDAEQEGYFYNVDMTVVVKFDQEGRLAAFSHNIDRYGDGARVEIFQCVFEYTAKEIEIPTAV